ADLHQDTRRHLRPVQTERDLVIAIVLIWHGQGKMVEDALAEAVADGEAMRRCEIDPRLPLRGIGGAALALLFNQPHLLGLPLSVSLRAQRSNLALIGLDLSRLLRRCASRNDSLQAVTVEAK